MGQRIIDENVIQEITRRIVRAANPVKVILFGSRGRGEAAASSDLDILVIEDEVGSRLEEVRRLRRVVRDLNVPIDLVVFDRAYAERYADIPGTVLYPAHKEGRILYVRE
jgi:predicted nucleotidyltransferase